MSLSIELEPESAKGSSFKLIDRVLLILLEFQDFRDLLRFEPLCKESIDRFQSRGTRGVRGCGRSLGWLSLLSWDRPRERFAFQVHLHLLPLLWLLLGSCIL